MTNLSTVDHTSSFEDVVNMLSRGIDAKGKPIDVKNFDQLSAKTIFDLYLETQKRDVILQLNSETGRVERFAQSVMVLILNTEFNIHWLEVSRRYPSGRVIHKEQEFTIRET